MAEENMSSKLLDLANKLNSIGLKAIKLQMKLIGTEFVVNRPKNNSKWKNVFGGTYSSESTLENDYETFTTRLIINMNEFKDVWNRNRDVIQTYTPEGNLELGDELQYTRNKITYRFKVTGKQGFSETADTMFIYVLTSIVETVDE
jgi:hypothetical protein